MLVLVCPRKQFQEWSKQLFQAQTKISKGQCRKGILLSNGIAGQSYRQKTKKDQLLLHENSKYTFNAIGNKLSNYPVSLLEDFCPYFRVLNVFKTIIRWKVML